MKSKDGFMLNVAECCFGPCLCLCSRCSLVFCKPTLKGWFSVKPGAPLNRAVQSLTPLGQVWFAGSKGTICRAASDFVSAGHGNGGESCLAACKSCC